MITDGYTVLNRKEVGHHHSQNTIKKSVTVSRKHFKNKMVSHFQLKFSLLSRTQIFILSWKNLIIITFFNNMRVQCKAACICGNYHREPATQKDILIKFILYNHIIQLSLI